MKKDKTKAYPTHRQIIQMSIFELTESISKNKKLGIDSPFSNRQVKQMKNELARKQKNK